MRYSIDGKWLLIGRSWIRLSDGFRLPVIQGGGKAITIQRAPFAFGDDDGSESAHTLDTENISRTGSAAQSPDETFMIRIGIAETAGGTDNLTAALFAQKNGAGGFVEVTTGSANGIIIADDTQSRADDENTTERLTAGGGTWTAGKYDDGQVQRGTTAITLDTNYSEVEFAIQIDSSNAADGDLFELRVQWTDGTVLDGVYPTPYPTVQADIGAAAQTVILNTAELNANAVFIRDVNPGTARLDPVTLPLQVSAESLAVLPALSVQLDTLALQISPNAQYLADSQDEILADTDGEYLRDSDSFPFACNITVVPGVATVALNTIELIATPIDLSVVTIAPQTVSLSTLELSASAPSLAVSPGAATEVLDSLELSVAPVDLSIDAPATLTLSTLNLFSEIPSLSVSPGASTISLDTLVLQSSAISITVSVGANVVSLSTAQITSQTPDITVSAGAASIGLDTLILNGTPIGVAIQGALADTVVLDTLTLQASAQHIRIQPEALVYMQRPVSRRYPYISRILSGETSVAPAIPPLTVALQSLQLTSRIENVTIVPAAASITLDTLQLNVSAVPISIALAAVAIALDTLQLTSQIGNIQVVAGAATIPLDTLELTATPIDLAVSPGAVSVTLDTLELSSNVISLSVSAGVASIQLDTLELNATAVDLQVVAQAVSVALQSLGLDVNTVPLTVTLGAVSVILDSLQLTAQVEPLDILASILMDSLQLNATAPSLDVVPSAVTTTLDTLELNVSAEPLTVALGAATVVLDSLQLTSNIIPLDVAAGAVTTSLDSLLLNAEAPDLSVAPGATTTSLDTLILSSYIDDISITISELIVQLDTLQLDAEAVSLAISPGAASQTLDTLILNATAVDLFGISLTPSSTVAGCIDMSDIAISDILVGDEAISIATLTDEQISNVTLTDTCNG